MAILSKLMDIKDKRQAVMIATSALSLSLWTFSIIKRSSITRTERRRSTEDDHLLYVEKSKDKKPESLKQMIGQLRSILKLIVGPKEYTFAFGVALALVVKTINDLWLINNGTQIEAAIITADMEKLKSNLGSFFLAMPTLSLINNFLKYCLDQLRLSLRYKLSVILYNRYVDGLTFYRLNMFDPNCQNIDQLLTSDVERFCHTIVDVYSNVSKPLLDIIILVHRLSYSYTGSSTPMSIIGYLIFAGSLLTSLRKPLTSLTVKETQLEGHLRYVHSRLIANCEEVAFYQGNNKERSILLSALRRLRSHLYGLSIFKFNIDFLDNLIARYFATVVGYVSLAVPFFSAAYSNHSQAFRLESYYKSGRMMVKLAESIGRLVLAGRDFTRLAAYTHRVNQLMKSIEKNRVSTFHQPIKHVSNDETILLIPGSGKLLLCDVTKPVIMFNNVPICTPGGDLLVKSLNVTIKHGTNVIISGPNGSGKSSLFRLLGGLWPLYGGELIKPSNDKLFYIPQKPYLTMGTFRDQIIYPDSLQEMNTKGVTDEDLREILKVVELLYLEERESFSAVLDWQEVLSGGEKQRVAIARLIYHKPSFAILDECTSAVSVDVEQSIYRYLTKEINCSLLSVTHRVKQLQHFHHFMLRFDGCGSYTYEALEHEDSVVV
ncbi:ATP-binding cassette sub-family D member 3-like protein [Leptotrombidium deliense]|uniref:ATP-binding cassette sub-family D member 3-like protein n=1 Tax=Leptotrombidium deliense TaxID=299467 RepID=A0A443SK72_9ACAR|nr:ATP-binding cassette sub-family D member 3-like protein [Leptotrombidium deliense]